MQGAHRQMGAVVHRVDGRAKSPATRFFGSFFQKRTSSLAKRPNLTNWMLIAFKGDTHHA
jgi:hypothetical protein